MTHIPVEARSRGRWHWLWMALFTLYTLPFFVVPRSFLPRDAAETWMYLRRTLAGWITEFYRWIGPESVTPLRINPDLISASYFTITALIIPWIVLLIVRHGRPYDLGIRNPNRIGWRVLIVGCVVAAPFLYWMVHKPGLAQFYSDKIALSGVLGLATSYGCTLFVEHFFFHGALLAMCRPGLKWPEPALIEPKASNWLVAALRWIGLAQPVGHAPGLRKVTRWIGLQDGCVVAVLLAGALFAVAHIGKNPRELLLSWPGGTALAYVSYRTNTWLIPFVLHFASGCIALAFVYWT